MTERSEKARRWEAWRQKLRSFSLAELVKYSRSFVREVEAGRAPISTAKGKHCEYLRAVTYRIGRGEMITDEQGRQLLADSRKLEQLYERFLEGS